MSVLAYLGAVESAAAATVTGDGGRLRYAAAPGERNGLTITMSGESYLIADPGAGSILIRSRACSTVAPAQVLCAPAGITAVEVAAGDGDDSVAYAGAVRATLDGGAGDDRLVGGPAADTLKGTDGADLLEGGGGGDQMLGGVGFDTADYSGRTAPVYVDLASPGGDGAAGEGDRIVPGVEAVAGGSGDDDIRGSRGSDVLDGRGGADVIAGGDGNDVIVGGAGTDELAGEGDADTVHARDGAAETVACGGARDSAVGDREDAFAGCELVEVPAAGTSDPPAGGGDPPAGTSDPPAGGGGGAGGDDAPGAGDPPSDGGAGRAGGFPLPRAGLSLSVRSRVVPMGGRAALPVRVACRAGGARRCRGTLKVTGLRARGGRGRRAAVVRLGGARVSIPPNMSAVVSIRLSRRARVRLAGHRPTRARAVLAFAGHDASGARVVLNQRLTLTLRRKRA